MGMFAFTNACRLCGPIEPSFDPRALYHCEPAYRLNNNLYHPNIRVVFLPLQLNGSGYKGNVDSVRIIPLGLQLLEDERYLMEAWCAVLGKRPDEYTIKDAQLAMHAGPIIRTTVDFHEPLRLESRSGIEWYDCRRWGS